MLQEGTPHTLPLVCHCHRDLNSLYVGERDVGQQAPWGEVGPGSSRREAVLGLPLCHRLGPGVGGARVFDIQSPGSTATPQMGVGKPSAPVQVTWLLMPETAPKAYPGEPSVCRKTSTGGLSVLDVSLA